MRSFVFFDCVLNPNSNDGFGSELEKQTVVVENDVGRFKGRFQRLSMRLYMVKKHIFNIFIYARYIHNRIIEFEQ